MNTLDAYTHDIKISELIRAGDVHLVKFRCPNCSAEELSGYPLTSCSACRINLDQQAVDFQDTFKRVLAGSKRRSGQRVSKKNIQFLYDLQQKQCAYCPRSLADTGYHVEHIVPLAAGGTNRIANLCLACPRCNLIASSKYFSSIDAKRDYIAARR